MAFNINEGRQQFTASSSQTIFNFNFCIFTDTDLKVYKTPVGQTPDDTADLLTIGTNYSVSINGTSGGTVTLTSGATLNDVITIVRDLPITRTTDYQSNGDLFADTLDSDQDYQTYLIQDRQNDLSRAVLLPDTISPGVSVTIPNPIADAYFKWNSTANAIENDTTIPTSVTLSEQYKGEAQSARDLALTYRNEAEGFRDEAEGFANSIDPSQFVKLTTDQSIGGIKTFGSFPITPSSAPTTDYQVANKKYVDDKVVIVPDATNSVKGIDYKSLLVEYTVTGSAVTSIDFSGLDINTHKSYRIEIEWNNISGSAVNLYAFINGDATVTNYYSQLFDSNGVTSAGVRYNTASLACPSANEKVSINAGISINQGYVTTRSFATRGVGSTVLTELISISKTATVTNITQLTFTASVASSIGVGSKIRLYRGDV